MGVCVAVAQCLGRVGIETSPGGVISYLSVAPASFIWDDSCADAPRDKRARRGRRQFDRSRGHSFEPGCCCELVIPGPC
eukprot:9322601-Pyramimonas_sp.AAC.1